MTPRRTRSFTIIALALALTISIASTLTAAPQGPAGDVGRDPRIEKILSQVSEPRIVEILKKLGSFGTRNTLSSTDSQTAGIGAARQWILDEMKKIQPEAAGQLRQLPGAEERPDHARHRAAERDGGAAGQERQARLHQRALRLVRSSGFGRAPCDGSRRGRIEQQLAPAFDCCRGASRGTGRSPDPVSGTGRTGGQSGPWGE